MADSIDLEIALVALLRLAVSEREEREDQGLAKRKTEVLLAETGMSQSQIATVTGKSPDAVRKTIARATAGK
ncbi:MAG TPA: hypothetical protein VHT29_07490 [Solirubrobacteraceae bacterium]|jgi:DNA-directed RNA polymerase specialized sigma24 family protein|nr:hypothetical protein [Solirubrobacteraceae bacterium]